MTVNEMFFKEIVIEMTVLLMEYNENALDIEKLEGSVARISEIIKLLKKRKENVEKAFDRVVG